MFSEHVLAVLILFFGKKSAVIVHIVFLYFFLFSPQNLRMLAKLGYWATVPAPGFHLSLLPLPFFFSLTYLLLFKKDLYLFVFEAVSL